ncbi:MAG: M4 family metallopeptidase [Bacteroidales bacterium]|nr:M4 family metallopeptidase [Bacteroidales bacterium]
MKKIINLCFIMLFVWGSIFAQSNNNNLFKNHKLTEIATSKYGGSILVFKPELNISVQDVFVRYKSNFGLGSNDDMRLIRTETDKFGFVQHRYQQYHKNVPIMDAIFILHSKDGKLRTGTGKIVDTFNGNALAQVSASEAVGLAIGTIGASVYAWDVKEMEQDLKTMKNDENATYYPTAELMFFKKNQNGGNNEYRLVYRTEILAINPFSRYYVYIDAQTGSVYHKTDIMMHFDKKVNAQTLYNGIREITMDSINSTQYFLRETGRGNGITTKNLQNNGDMTNPAISSAIDIISDQSFFVSDPTAASAHWASEMTYDYYSEIHNRNSYDNNGAAMMSYVHWGNNIANAMWTGSSMVYGDGDNTYSPFTTVEICGHEITHAVTQYTANLIYEYESGALNEAFSDIFGSMVRLYATDTVSWLIGQDVGQAFRNMSNPKANQNPDTYKGQYWHTASSDNGGVHVNNGIGNYFFYLITDGDSGTNDFGYTYDIIGMGPDKSQYIAYRALSNYLLPGSQYIDAYSAMLQSSDDIHGECSEESFVVAEAWAAVGVGYPFDSTAIFLPQITGPANACGLTMETVSLDILYNGCNRSLASGTELHVKVGVDVNTFYYDTLIVNTPINGGETVNVVLNELIDVSPLGNHRIDVWLKPSTHQYYTDSIIGHIVHNSLQQNFDLGAKSILSPASSCHLGDAELITMEFSFLGCDSLAAGEVVRLGYMLNQNDTIFENHTLQATIFPGDVITHTFNTSANFTNVPINNLKAFTANTDDVIVSNNTTSAIVKKPTLLNQIDFLAFNESNVEDYYMKSTGQWGKVRIKSLAGYSGGKVINLTAGNVFDYYDELEMPTPGNEWNTNEMLSAKASFCYDATDAESLHMVFDLQQTSGDALYAQFLGAGDYTMASSMRILINGEHWNNYTFNPATPGNDPFETKILNVSQYIGDIIEVTFETRNISGDTLIFKLDNAFIDNLHFVPNSADNIVENDAPKSIEIFPNPSNGNFTMLISNDKYESTTIEIFDMAGRIIYKQAAILQEGINVINLSASHLSNGIYFVSTNVQGKKITQKMLVKK